MSGLPRLRDGGATVTAAYCARCHELFCRCTGGPTATVVSASAVPVVTVEMTVQVGDIRKSVEEWLRDA